MNYSAPKISKANKLTSTLAALVSSQSEQSSSMLQTKIMRIKKEVWKSNMQVDDEISFAVTQPAKKSRGRPRKQNTQ